MLKNFSDYFYIKFPLQAFANNHNVETKQLQSKNATFSSYCRQLDEGKEYDGTLEYTYYFPSQTLSQAYNTLINLDDYRHARLKNKLPTKNLSYRIDDKKNGDETFDYQWMTDKRVKIVAKKEMESSTYLFEEMKIQTHLLLIEETGY
ncbi:hypothetical protein ACRGNN_000871 [Providencia stuartii]|uniref:hypothetical protein n=1 Tax=Providencia stuartii TaxID=588 RepID=UPI0018C74133|nr:hypothetical protein [Providencia stuartii]EMD1716374.1 hypothetical protein [Providencia stuartii]MBG5907091.1 hypothetical protein [Providencia stuartii]WAZ73971.1 hypothetical protein O4Z98_15240 [Providencia stuartii]HEM6894016.1 hypothetical protein [Providencia stuartii]